MNLGFVIQDNSLVIQSAILIYWVLIPAAQGGIEKTRVQMINRKSAAATVDTETGAHNFRAFIWHALFLALTMSFIDLNTVVPNMIGEAGGTAVHLGFFTAIMVGGTSFMQLFFAGFLLSHPRKKPFLLTGIYLRVSALIALGVFLLTMDGGGSSWMVLVILGIMAVFSFGGSFANISYVDIIGRSIEPDRRTRFFMFKQLISSIGLIVSSLIVKVILTVYPYPRNYSILFIAAAVLLLIATAGFWMIREPMSAVRRTMTVKERLVSFRDALVKDRNLRLYLLLINTSGIALSTTPFLILFGRSHFDVTGSMVGTFLLVQMGGGLITNILLNLFHKGQRYKGIMYLFVGAGAISPILALLLIHGTGLYALVFLFSGAAYAMYQVIAPGVLVEISNDENRPVYTGLSGAGSFMNIIYPVTAGYMITQFGFPAVFILSSGIMLTGIFAVRNIVCERLQRPILP